MLPLPLPPGTTLASLVETLLPAAHAASVPASAPREPITIVLSLAGSPSPRVYTLVVRGATLTVRTGESATRDVWIHADGVIADHFVADWSAGASLAPRWKTVPGKAEVPALLTDPRILRRVQMVNGRVELALSDFSLGRAALTLASGAAANRPLAQGPADATIELTMVTVRRLASRRRQPRVVGRRGQRQFSRRSCPARAISSEPTSCPGGGRRSPWPGDPGRARARRGDSRTG